MKENLMDVYNCIKTKLAVREFKIDPVPDSLVLRILQAGRWAPSSMNHQPWQFIVIKEKPVLESAVAIGEIRPFVATAPMAIAIVMDDYDRPLLDAGRALQQMQLMAWSDGIGSCFVGIPEQNITVLKRFLKIPEHLDLISIMPFGFPSNKIEGFNKVRKPLSQLVHSEKFGEAYQL